MKAPLGTGVGLTEVATGFIGGVAMDGHIGKPVSMKTLSELPVKIRFDCECSVAVPRVGNLFRYAVKAIGPIWILTIVNLKVSQGPSRPR